ncbi:adenosylcobinamide kinase / adenosylcobinamide-phosphate guanylyltransferase [Blastococcus aurantiacus]|uniref:Adenosylcobinamide kinase / adenosylcobinamide-phosphate guanylyltransferase n=1 Tax=Blastococcus aurantiacus TaxID=1550231 RepID=A0A1G7LVM6_9ACTN|nr:adenosylcobinamide kinase / adenosylcobinamide-phosphate guanylyltransferase [Blastococcus aurantiacus]
MHVRLLGTGAADGWPNPWCSCASCSDARSRGETRRQTSVLVDGAVLLELSPALPPDGVSLAGVHTVLVTHAHPDHCAPAALLWRHWVLPDERLALAGPADVLEACRPWLAPGAPVDLVEAVPGRTLRCRGYQVRVLPADHEVPTVLYDVAGPDGARLLYATDTGPLPDAAVEAVAGAEFDVVLLEETFGDRLDHGTRHLDLAGFPAQLDRLRAVGAVTAATDVVAVHLGHHDPPAGVLAERLARYGARMLPDGAELDVPARVARG